MLQTGDWWTVHFNGAPNFEYPPVFIWLEAASMKVLGVNDYAAKLPSALAGLGTILILYLLVAELTADLWLAEAAMFVLATSQLFVKYATHAMTDVPFTFFVTLALYLYVKAIRQRWYFLLAGIPIAIAILTRSVIGVFPLVVISAHLLLTRGYRRVLSFEFAAMWAIALGLPLLWFGIPPRPEHIAFIAGKVGAGATWIPTIHVLDYGWMLLRFYWPWLPLLAAGVFIDLRARRLLPILWCLCLLAPLSLASTKYARYLLPAFPALAMLTSSGVNRVVPRVRRDFVLGAACVALLIVTGFTMLFPAKERGVDMRTLAPVADRNTQPGERVFIYSAGDTAYDIQNQFLWYSDRYSRLITSLNELANTPDATLIIDKTSYAKFVTQMTPHSVRILAESDKFIFVRLVSKV